MKEEEEEEKKEEDNHTPFPDEQKQQQNNKEFPIAINRESPNKVFGNNKAQEAARNFLNENRDDLRRKDDQRHNMADPNYLSRKEAIDRQNSFGKPRGRGQWREQLSEREDLLRRQRHNEDAGAGGGGVVARKRGSVPSLWAGLSDADRKVVKAKAADMEQNFEKALDGDAMSHKQRQHHLPETPLLAAQQHRGGRGEPGRIAVLGSLDVEAYLGPQRMVEGDGGDKMKNFQYNQVVSDATRPDRYLRDYRNPL